MVRRIELIFRVFPSVVDGRTNEGARDGDDILLLVTSVDAQRVQLHQLTTVVFVEAWAADWSSVRSNGNGQVIARSLGLPVIEIKKHRGMPRSRQQQIL